MHPYHLSKDLVGFYLFAVLIPFFVFFYPNYIGYPDNSILANPLATPHHVVPKWYLLPLYAI